VRSRLARARALLHRRLVARGVAPAVAPLEALLSSTAAAPSLRLIERTTRLVTYSHASWHGTAVASASTLSLVNGVVDMMNLKKAAVILSLALPLGSLVVAGAALGYQQPPEAEQRDRAVRRPSDEGLIKKTYFVGDIGSFRNYQVEQPDGRPAPALKPIGGLPGYNISRLVNMIRSVVAPGTWKMDDAEAPGARIGSITPTADGRYLAIRHTADVIDQVEVLFFHLRPIMEASIWNAIDQVAPSTSREPIRVKTPPIQAEVAEKDEAPGGKAEAQSERRRRVRRLLRQLQVELDAMDAESTGATKE
jgi:hypothetical protein